MLKEEAIEIICSKCGHEAQESVASLKVDSYTCSECGASFDPNQLDGALIQIETSLATFSDS